MQETKEVLDRLGLDSKGWYLISDFEKKWFKKIRRLIMRKCLGLVESGEATYIITYLPKLYHF